MDLDAAGALVIAGNTDIAVADGDFAAAFPWLDEVPVGQRAAAEWAREQLTAEQLEYLRRLPAERRLRVDEEPRAGLPRLTGQPDGGPAERPGCRDHDAGYVTRTDARVICCGHTHVADVRELGRKLILNPGSCGYAFDGSPDACWALLTLVDGAEPEARLAARRLRRPGRGAGGQRARAALGRLPGRHHPHREVRAVSAGRRGAPRRRDRPGGGHAAGHAACPPTGGASWRASRACAPSRIFDASDLPSRIAGEVPDFDPSVASSTARRCGATTAPPRWPSWPPTRRSTTPACRRRLEGELAEETGILMASGLGGTGTLIEQIGPVGHAAARRD